MVTVEAVTAAALQWVIVVMAEHLPCEGVAIVEDLLSIAADTAEVDTLWKTGVDTVVVAIQRYSTAATVGTGILIGALEVDIAEQAWEADRVLLINAGGETGEVECINLCEMQLKGSFLGANSVRIFCP